MAFCFHVALQAVIRDNFSMGSLLFFICLLNEAFLEKKITKDCKNIATFEDAKFNQKMLLFYQ